MSGKPPVIEVVSAAVLADERVRITRASDGALHVLLRAGTPITSPVAELITDAIGAEWREGSGSTIARRSPQPRPAA